MKNRITYLFLVVMLSGCASVSTPMKSADGKVINCGASGFGLIGAPAAVIMKENCVSEAREKGFVPLDETPSVMPVSNASPYTGKVTLSLPDGWARKPPPANVANVIVYATNATLDAYVMVNYDPKKDITDVAQYAETRKASQLSRLGEPSSTEMIRTEIQGHKAYSTEIEGVLRASNVRNHFITTVIDGTDEIIRFGVWTTAANFSPRVKKQLGEIRNGLGGL